MFAALATTLWLLPQCAAYSLTRLSSYGTKLFVSMSASSSEVEVKTSTVLPMFSTEEQGLKVSISQLSSGPVPRGYLPGLVTINRAKESSSMGFAALEAGLAFYLDGGGRVSKLYACSPRGDTDLQQHVCSIGFEALEESMSTIREEGVVKLVESNGLSLHENRLYSCRPEELRKHCEQRLAQNSNAADTLHDILGRLLHDAGNPKEAINSYTSALLVNPKSAAIFRNLGSAYHATGDMQLAFASYQQALQLDSTDILVYLKLAYLYEDLAGKDWPEAAEHAQKCYQFYLDKVDAEDTSVLTRLGNLLMKEHSYEEAAAVYKKALDIDPRLFNVWFNLAHSQLKLGDHSNAMVSLKQTLEINPNIPAARHMLKALSDEDSEYVMELEDDYIKDLFNSYGSVYDDQVKKLRYAAPRVIRQEMARIYKAKYEKEMSVVIPGDRDYNVAGEQIGGSGCSTYTTFMNASLDILDLGCGTGLAGSWLKDYARSMVGVDISEKMILAAGKKMLYQDLQVKSIADYIATCQKTFDLVVAADVLAYIGELTETIQQVIKVMRPGSHFVFTIETCPEEATGKGFKLLRNGRFGYSQSYMTRLLSALKDQIDIVLCKDFSPRNEMGEPVAGYLYVLQRL